MLPSRMRGLFKLYVPCDRKRWVLSAFPRSISSDGISIFDRMRNEKLRYKPEDGYSEQVESRKSSERSDRDASEPGALNRPTRKVRSWRADDDEWDNYEY